MFDGRNSLRDLALPAGVAYRGIGVPARPRATASRRRGRPRPGRSPAVRVRIVSVVGTRPQLIKAAALLAGAAGAPRRGLRRHRPALGRGDGRRVLRRARPAAARPLAWGSAAAAQAEQTGRMLTALEPILARGAARRGPRLRRHELDARRRARRGEARHPGRPRRGRAALLRPADARGDQPGRRRPPLALAVRADADRGREPRRRGDRRRRHARRRPDAGPRRADRRRRSAIRPCSPRSGGLRRASAICAPGGYLFATVHRAENRDAGGDARPGRRSSGDRRARTGRSCSRSIPGTPAALDAAGDRARRRTSASSSRRATGRRWRSSSTPRPSLTDSGGVQREAAWLGVPVPRPARRRPSGSEAVAESGGRMVVVGLDAERAAGRARPARAAGRRGADRASIGRRGSTCEPAGAADAIVGGPRRERSGAGALAGASREPGRVRPTMRVVMFVRNDVTVDARILKEAASLRDAGHAVTIMAITRPDAPREIERDPRDGFDIVRRPAAPLAPLVALVPAAVPALVDAEVALDPRPRAASAWTGSTGWRCGGSGRWAGLARRRGGGRRRRLPRPRPDGAPGRGVRPPAAQPRARSVVYDSHELYLDSGRDRRPAALGGRTGSSDASASGRREVDALVTVSDGLGDVLAEAARDPRRSRSSTTARRARRGRSSRTNLVRETLGLPDDVRVVIYTGGLRAGRGIEELARAMLEPGLEAVHLAFLGFGPLAADVEAIEADPRYGGRVHLLKPVSPLEVVEWVSSTDVAGMAIQATNRSYELSTPNKLFEAFAAGVPVAGSDFPGFRTIVLDNPEGPLGELCRPDVAGLDRRGDPADPRAAPGRVRARWRRELASGGASSAGTGRPSRPSSSRCTAGWPARDRRPVAIRPATTRPSPASARRARSSCPSNGAFDSRTWRIASTLAARGHDVTVMARSEAGLPDREDHPAGYRIVRVPVSAVAGLPWPLRPLVVGWRRRRGGERCAGCGGRGVAVGRGVAAAWRWRAAPSLASAARSRPSSGLRRSP